MRQLPWHYRSILSTNLNCNQQKQQHRHSRAQHKKRKREENRRQKINDSFMAYTRLPFKQAHTGIDTNRLSVINAARCLNDAAMHLHPKNTPLAYAASSPLSSWHHQQRRAQQRNKKQEGNEQRTAFTKVGAYTWFTAVQAA